MQIGALIIRGVIFHPALPLMMLQVFKEGRRKEVLSFALLVPLVNELIIINNYFSSANLVLMKESQGRTVVLVSPLEVCCMLSFD